MFIQSSASATLRLVSINSAWPLQLELTDAARKTSWFMDRPVREAGRVTNEKFLDTIGDFPSNPVNAALLVAIDGSSEDNVSTMAPEPGHVCTDYLGGAN